MRVTVVGASGFVGSAFTRLLNRAGVDLVAVTRDNYLEHAGSPSDVVIEAACNSKKFLADNDPFGEFDLSVTHRLRTLRDFPAALHVHLSSVDVYADLTSAATTREDTPIEPGGPSHYGFHKYLAEQLVGHHARKWLILRLAGMVGPGLRKNPVFDLLHDRPLRIHPDSRYQFMNTNDVAMIAWNLVTSGVCGAVFNVCGQGLVSPREMAELIGREPDLSQLAPEVRPRIVDVNTEKLGAIVPLPSTRESVQSYLRSLAEN
jgi:nucleoside-diphosphate-sugar epimerase